MQENMRKEFKDIDYFAESADGWSKFRRGFLGVMVTWLDKKTLERKFAGLSLQRMKGRHTYERIAKDLSEILVSYQLDGKVVKFTADSGSNFIKAFRVFGPDDLPQAQEPGMEEEDVDDPEEDGDEDDPPERDGELVPMDLDAIMDALDAEAADGTEHACHCTSAAVLTSSTEWRLEMR
ncbi:Elongation factor 4 [Frankliniella fusca]|uniref:Elongation factor 4 n=1 Tax=Frankliniella fusca TaxID=407009 RepID=A0AAE1HNP6_9NEOP|nr:Elongation factor 4 [Frankliniella fusca]